MLRIYPAPAVIILVVCGIVISYASQQQQNYDPRWLAISSLLFMAGCLVSYNIVRQMPAPRIRIATTLAMWERATTGFVVGIVAVTAAFFWLLWGANTLSNGDWASIAIVMIPALAFGLAGLFLVYYWLGLWAFGVIVRDQPTETSKPKNDPK